MAQEPAKTPLDAGDGPPEGLATIEPGGTSSSDLEAGSEDRKPSLAERLRAEQRRATVAKPRPEDSKQPAVGDAAAKAAARNRRAAGPVQRRIATSAANDDV